MLEVLAKRVHELVHVEVPEQTGPPKQIYIEKNVSHESARSGRMRTSDPHVNACQRPPVHEGHQVEQWVTPCSCAFWASTPSRITSYKVQSIAEYRGGRTIELAPGRCFDF